MSKWTFELLLEEMDYTNPNNPRKIYFTPEQIKEMKKQAIKYWKEQEPDYYQWLVKNSSDQFSNQNQANQQNKT